METLAKIGLITIGGCIVVGCIAMTVYICKIIYDCLKED
jgi:hypothetical protein